MGIQGNVNGFSWTLVSPIKYWPQAGDVVFYGFYPIESSLISDSKVPSVKWANIGKMDIMWAKNEDAIKTAPINFHFQHKLMKIKFKLIKGEGFGENTKLVKWNVLGGDDSNKLAKEASLNLKTGEVTFDKNNEYIINVLGEQTALSIPDTGYEDCLFINPLQKIKIALSSSNMDYPDVCVDLPDGDTGKFYTVSITLHGMQVSVSVNHSWTDNELGEQIIK